MKEKERIAMEGGLLFLNELTWILNIKRTYLTLIMHCQDTGILNVIHNINYDI